MPSSLRSCTLVLLCAFAVRSAAGQITVTDDLGRTVTLPRAAQRVVSLAPSITESLFAIGAGAQIAGVTAYCNYPPAAALKPRIGGMTTPSIESIIALRPDLILISMEGNLRDDYSRIMDIRVPVVVSNPRNLEDIYRSLAVLGRLTGESDSASRVVAALRARQDALLRTAPSRSVRTLLFVSLQPLIAAGNGTFLHALLRSAGGTNLAALTGLSYPTLSREAVIAYNPDVVFVMSDLAPSTDAMIRLYPEWSRLDAMRNGRIHRIDADIISRPGPRAVDGLHLLFSLLHRNAP
jgi:iron complex transport system substrate-binding protein